MAAAKQKRKPKGASSPVAAGGAACGRVPQGEWTAEECLEASVKLLAASADPKCRIAADLFYNFLTSDATASGFAEVFRGWRSGRQIKRRQEILLDLWRELRPNSPARFGDTVEAGCAKYEKTDWYRDRAALARPAERIPGLYYDLLSTGRVVKAQAIRKEIAPLLARLDAGEKASGEPRARIETMALKDVMKAQQAVPAGAPMPPIMENEDYKKAFDKLQSFYDGEKRLRDEKARIDLEKTCRDWPEGFDKDRKAEYRKRLDELRAMPPLKLAGRIGGDTPLSAVEHATALLDGTGTAARPDEAEYLAEIDRQIDVLLRAEAEQKEIVDDIQGWASYHAAVRFKPEWDAAHLAAFEAARALSRAWGKMHHMHSDFVSKGYSFRSDILNWFNAQAPRQLGDETGYHGEIALWRRWLEDNGII